MRIAQLSSLNLSHSLPGYSTRECVEGGTWSDIDETGCVSPEGQQVELLAESLEQGQLLSQEEADYASMSLVQFAGSGEISGGDLQASGRLLAGLIELQRLRGADSSSNYLKVHEMAIVN